MALTKVKKFGLFLISVYAIFIITFLAWRRGQMCFAWNDFGESSYLYYQNSKGKYGRIPFNNNKGKGNIRLDSSRYAHDFFILPYGGRLKAKNTFGWFDNDLTPMDTIEIEVIYDPEFYDKYPDRSEPFNVTDLDLINATLKNLYAGFQVKLVAKEFRYGNFKLPPAITNADKIYDSLAVHGVINNDLFNYHIILSTHDIKTSAGKKAEMIMKKGGYVFFGNPFLLDNNVLTVHELSHRLLEGHPSDSISLICDTKFVDIMSSEYANCRFGYKQKEFFLMHGFDTSKYRYKGMDVFPVKDSRHCLPCLEEVGNSSNGKTQEFLEQAMFTWDPPLIALDTIEKFSDLFKELFNLSSSCLENNLEIEYNQYIADENIISEDGYVDRRKKSIERLYNEEMVKALEKVLYNKINIKLDKERMADRQYFQEIKSKLTSKSYQGKVLNKPNHPLVGATVKAEGITTFTDAKGNFTIVLLGDVHSINISYPGYESKTIEKDKITDKITLKINNESKVYNCKVINTSKAPVHGATIKAKGITTFTNTKGNFTIVLPAHVHSIDIWHSEYAPLSVMKEKITEQIVLQDK